MATKSDDWTLVPDDGPEHESPKRPLESDKWIDRKQPFWIKCLTCEGYFCTMHETHTQDCACPPIEDWTVSPYLPPPPEGTTLWDRKSVPGRHRPGIFTPAEFDRFAFRWTAILMTMGWAWRELLWGSAAFGIALALTSIALLAFTKSGD